MKIIRLKVDITAPDPTTSFKMEGWTEGSGWVPIHDAKVDGGDIVAFIESKIPWYKRLWNFITSIFKRRKK